MRATRAIIHLDNLRQNIRVVRERIGFPLICLPVKADAYGHGAVPVARAGLEAGADCLAVAAVDEGAELREAGIDAPILLFTLPLPEELPRLIALHLTPFVFDREFIRLLADALESALPGPKGRQPFPVHLKIDTGMGRAGCRPEEAPDLAAFICRQKNLELAGVATHLAASDSTTEDDIGWTKTQLVRFREAVEGIKAGGLHPGIVHAANSGATALHEDAWFDMVRPGIALYGYSPFKDGPAALPVKPIMELSTQIVSIKHIKQGESVSYGRTWTAAEDTTIGILPLGYGDGLPRSLSGKWKVRMEGGLYPLIGRICMDQCMVNLGAGAKIPRWAKACIFGPGMQDAADMAAVTGTIPYEITCNINKRVKRIYEG
ncbi:MAG: alanine racemase [Treponema sp.]|jgi:alanine racemase|nr:alanine racemase [Treponema sp.]